MAKLLVEGLIEGFGEARLNGLGEVDFRRARESSGDRKSTRLNSSHVVISYAVFCLKKKNNTVSTLY